MAARMKEALTSRPFTITWQEGTTTRTTSFDAVVSESHTGTNTISKYQVQNGYKMSDHAIRENRTITISGIISNIAIGGLDVDGATYGSKLGSLLGFPVQGGIIGGLFNKGGAGVSNYIDGAVSSVGSLLDSAETMVTGLIDSSGTVSSAIGEGAEVDFVSQKAGDFIAGSSKVISDASVLMPNLSGMSLPSLSEIPSFAGKDALVATGSKILDAGGSLVDSLKAPTGDIIDLFADGSSSSGSLISSIAGAGGDLLKLGGEIGNRLLDAGGSALDLIKSVVSFNNQYKLSKVDQMFSDISNLHEQAYMCRVSTMLEVYDPAILTSYTIKQDPDKSTILWADLVFEEVRVRGFSGEVITAVAIQDVGDEEAQDLLSRARENLKGVI